MARENTNGKKFNGQQSLNSAIKSICDIMRRSNCAGALQYVPELTWILFLRILDEQEAKDAERAEAVGAELTLSLESPYRWQDWAAPPGVGARHGVPLPGWKRKEHAGGTLGAFKGFVDGELIPHLKKLKERPNATARQKVISEIFSGIDRTRIDTERNLLDILDKVHEISGENVDTTHVFTLSQIYEGLLLKMGEKGNDGGQFFTPREIIRAMVRVIDPKVGEPV
jgi:type I restriction enzyme M protein